MSILIKAGAGLVAGVVAGALGLAFMPQVEPNAVKPRQAVGKAQFVDATVNTVSPTPSVSVAAVPVEPTPKAEASPAPKVEPAPEAEAKAAPRPEAAPTPQPSAQQVAKNDPAPVMPPGPTRGIDLSDAPKSTPSSAMAETRAAAPRATPANAASARWSVQGLVALAKGDLSTARLCLSRAAEAGDPRALVALADTYDPAMLARLGVVGAPGDPQRARDYLVKAAAAGVDVSKDRMAALDQTANSVH